jgi:hypothetical protein
MNSITLFDRICETQGLRQRVPPELRERIRTSSEVDLPKDLDLSGITLGTEV